ncbi:mCG146319, partial [Mus musculus]
ALSSVKPTETQAIQDGGKPMKSGHQNPVDLPSTPPLNCCIRPSLGGLGNQGHPTQHVDHLNGILHVLRKNRFP